MGLFGITLKKLEAIPGDIVHGVEGMFHGGPAPGGGQNPQANNQGVYQSPASQAASAVRPTPVAPPPAANPALNAPPSATPDNAPHDGDVIGLRKALNGLGAYSQDDQARIINRASKAGLIAHNVAAATQDQILSPNLPTDRSPVGQLAQAGEDVLLPGASNLAKQVGTNLASNSLLDKSLSGQYDPSTVNNTLNEANANNGGIVDNLKGVNYAKLADASAQGALGIAGALTAPEVGAFATRNAGRVEAAVNQGKDYLQSLKLFDPVNDHVSQNPFLGQVEPIAQTPELPVVPNNGRLAVPSDLPPQTANAAKKLSNLYSGKLHSDLSGEDLLKQTTSIPARFSRVGNSFEKAVAAEFTPEEDQLAHQHLEGSAPAEAITPKIQAYTDILKQLNERGYKVLDKEPVLQGATPLHRVGQYASRVVKSTTNAVTGNKLTNTINDLADIRSGFAKSRSNLKFVSPDGETLYGNKEDLGLTDKGNNSFVDGDGKKFKAVFAPQQELENATGIEYEKNASKAANQYHSSVGRVKGKQDVVNEFLRSPSKYGLSTNPGKGLRIIEKGELSGYYAPKSLATRAEKTLGYARPVSLPERAWRGLMTGVIQPIVYNALFHTRNLSELAGLAAGKVFGALGPAYAKRGVLEYLAQDEATREALRDEFLENNNHFETYGSDRPTMLSNAFDRVDMPHINKTLPAIMAKADETIRMGLYYALTRYGDVAPKDTSGIIDRFLGDHTNTGPIAQNVGLFWNYFKTRVGVVADALRHPNENEGVYLAAAEQAAILYGTTKAFQEWTGNQHASLGHPGIFGLVNEADQIAHGRGAAATTSSVNPLITAIENQRYGKDLYNGKSLLTGKDRLNDLKDTLFAPSQNIAKMSNGKASAGQEALQMGLGVSLPHVKGAPAIPNTKNPLANTVNLKGAKAAADEKTPDGKVVIHDPTGIEQANRYYDAKTKALKAVAGDPAGTDAINAYLDDNVNSKGQTVKKDPSQSIGVAKMLAGSPDALAAMQKMQKSQPSHDPMWDLSTKDLKTFLDYNSNPNDMQEAAKIIDSNFNKGQGLTNFAKQRDDYYANNKFPAGSALDNPETPKYPGFQGEQQSEYNLYKQQYQNSTDAKAKAQFIQDHPLVADAIHQLSDYYDKDAVAKGFLAQKDNVQLSPEQQTWFKWYNSLPKGSGERSAAIKANPEMWSNIANALAQSTLVNLAKAGGVNQYQGVPWQQDFLKDAYDAGKYDISSGVPLPGGGSGFAVKETTPQTIASGSDSSSGKAKFARSSASSKTAYARLKAQVKSDSQARDMEHAAKAADSSIRRVNKINKIHGPKRLSIHMRGETSVQPFKVKGATLKARQINKVAAKPVKALNRGNRATLKA